MIKTPILLLLLISTIASGQDNENTDILLTKSKQNGVYRTFLEFRSNSPSIVGTLKITNHRIKLLNDKNGKFENIKENFWGACVNDTIYVFHKEVETTASPHIYPLEFLGRYCYFSDSEQAWANVGTPSPMAMGYTFAYVININNGMIYKLDRKLMYKILEKDPYLLEAFEAEPQKQPVFRTYIEKINEKRRGDIKPVEELLNREQQAK